LQNLTEVSIRLNTTALGAWVAMKVRDTASGHSAQYTAFGFECTAGSGSSYVAVQRGNIYEQDASGAYVQAVGGVLLASVRVYTARLETEQSSWAFRPVKIGVYFIWFDSYGNIRYKNGEPLGEFDGRAVLTA
jgi:hypothetical protein